jgi:hypothetical protein
MMGKAGLVAGMAAGYVLGARDGRGRYEQIKTQAERLWNDPKVQQQASAAQDLVRQKAPQVADKISQVTDKASGRSSSTDTGAGGPVGPSTTSAPSSVTPATAPVAKGPELHAETVSPVTPGGLDV